MLLGALGLPLAAGAQASNPAPGEPAGAEEAGAAEATQVEESSLVDGPRSSKTSPEPADATTSQPAAPAAQRRDATPVSEPTGSPPQVVAADPRWHEPAASARAAREPTAPTPTSNVDAGLGVELLLVQGKAMPSTMFRFGEQLYWGKLEFSPIWLTQASSDFGGRFLGNHWGFHFMLAPIRRRNVELFAGVGLDIYHLWGIHGDEALFALTLQSEVVLRASERLGLLATLRGYPWHSDGLELGVNRRGVKTVPLLAGLGVEWRFE